MPRRVHDNSATAAMAAPVPKEAKMEESGVATLPPEVAALPEEETLKRCLIQLPRLL